MMHYLDITSETCPFTLVRTKIFLQNLPPDTVVHIRLNGGEPLDTIPKALKELGHHIIDQPPNYPPNTPGVHLSFGSYTFFLSFKIPKPVYGKLIVDREHTGVLILIKSRIRDV